MDPANIFIIIGAIIFGLAFLGCIGSLRENICFLRTFEYTIDVLLLLQLAAAVYVYVDRDRVKKNVEDVLKDTIPNYREDSDFQSIIDWVQEKMKCCGVIGPDDWDRNDYFNCSNTKNLSGERCAVPYSCCRDYKEEQNTQCGYSIRDSNKYSNLQKRQTIYEDGCLDKTFQTLLNQNNLILLLCVGASLILLELITTGLAHHLVDGIRRQKAKWNQPRHGNQNMAYH